MTPRIGDNTVAVFVVDRRLLETGVVFGRWFRPQTYADGEAFESHVLKFLASRCPGMKPRDTLTKNAYTVLESNCVEHRVVRRGPAQVVVSHCRSCAAYDLETVRAYHAVFGTWPTVGNLRERFVGHRPDVLHEAAVYLASGRRAQAWRKTLRTPRGRLRLLRRVRELLPTNWTLHVDFKGEAWLFLKTRGVKVRPPATDVNLFEALRDTQRGRRP